MTVPTQETQVQAEPNNKEINFRKLEEKFEKQLLQERQAREEAERRIQELISNKSHQEEQEDDSEPYVDHKRLEKKLSSFEKKMEEKIDKKAEERAQHLLYKKEQEDWLDNNGDFYDVMKNADKLAEKNPSLAKMILRMPEGFERQKLVYENIKTLGLHKPEVKQQSIQEVVDKRQKGPYYQPTGVGTAPYAATSDFSPLGQKQAYDKLQELKNRMRL